MRTIHDGDAVYIAKPGASLPDVGDLIDVMCNGWLPLVQPPGVSDLKWSILLYHWHIGKLDCLGHVMRASRNTHESVVRYRARGTADTPQDWLRSQFVLMDRYGMI